MSAYHQVEMDHNEMAVTIKALKLLMKESSVAAEIDITINLIDYLETESK